MANEEKELYKFVNDPKYRDKVIAKVHKNEDNAYNKRIKQIEKERDNLSKSRTNEIARIANARWEKLAGGKILVNRTEGKIQLNGVTAAFSSIQGAELNMMAGMRVITKETTSTKSKKHASLGGAVAGGLVLGPVGAVAGGVGLGKTKGQTTGTTISDQIPTCTHLGVMVNLDGFASEVVLLASQVDQSSPAFLKAQSDAQNIIAQLGALAKTPVPAQFLRPEEESSVKVIESQIADKQAELQQAIADRPTYALPAMYRTPEQRELSDKDYLEYLYNTDAQRMLDNANKEAERKERKKSVNAGAVRADDSERYADGNAKKDTGAVRADDSVRYDEKNAKKDTGVVRKVASVIYDIVFWAFSVFMLLFAIVAFTSSGTVSGVLFLITAAAINPLIGNVIRDKVFDVPKWVPVVILIIGFLAGILTFPSSDAAVQTTSQTTFCYESVGLDCPTNGTPRVL